MEQKNKVSVKINGQEYSIVGAETKEYLLKVSNFVDEKMESIAKANKKLSTSMIAVLTAVNIADQYLKIKNRFEELEKDTKKPQQEISELKKYIETLQDGLNEKDEAYSALEKSIEDIKATKQENEQVDLLKRELLEKEKSLEKAQVLINELRNKLFAHQIKLVEATNELDECMRKNDFLEKCLLEQNLCYQKNKKESYSVTKIFDRIWNFSWILYNSGDFIFNY